MRSLFITLLITLFSMALIPAVNAKNDQSDFCSKVSSISEQMITNMKSKKHTKINDRELDQQKIKTVRDRAEAKRSEAYEKLNLKYTTSAQQSAIKEYKESIDLALKTRYEKTDLARENFIIEINKLIDQHEKDLDEAEQKAFMAIRSVGDSAASQCADGSDSEIVRTSFKQGLRSAKNDFRVNKVNTEADKTKVDELIKQRKQSIDSAMEEFKRAAEIAKNRLISALR